MKWLGWILAAGLACAWILSFPEAPRPEPPPPEEIAVPEEDFLRRVEELEEENRDLRRLLEARPSLPTARAPAPTAEPRKEETPPAQPPRPGAPASEFATLHGSVLDQKGRALPKVLVKVDGQSLGYQASAKTAVDGSFRFAVPPGSYEIQVRTREGKVRPGAEEVTLGPGQVLEKHFLLPHALVEVPFLDAETRAPILSWEEALPRLRAEKQRYEPECLIDGRLQFLGLPDGTYAPVYQGKEHEAAQEAPVSVGGQTATALIMRRLALLQVCFTDPSGNPPQEKIFLEWRRKLPPADEAEDGRLGRSGGGRETKNLPPTPDGCHSLPLRAGNYTLTFRKGERRNPPFHQAEAEVPRSGTVPLRIAVP